MAPTGRPARSARVCTQTSCCDEKERDGYAWRECSDSVALGRKRAFQHAHGVLVPARGTGGDAIDMTAGGSGAAVIAPGHARLVQPAADPGRQLHAHVLNQIHRIVGEFRSLVARAWRGVINGAAGTQISFRPSRNPGSAVPKLGDYPGRTINGRVFRIVDIAIARQYSAAAKQWRGSKFAGAGPQ